MTMALSTSVRKRLGGRGVLGDDAIGVVGAVAGDVVHGVIQAVDDSFHDDDASRNSCPVGLAGRDGAIGARTAVSSARTSHPFSRRRIEDGGGMAFRRRRDGPAGIRLRRTCRCGASWR
jgi:hypothetical protein